MPGTESEYGDDIRLLDDLTRLKLRLIDKKLHHHPSPRLARSRTPDVYTPPIYPERKRDRFHRRIDRRNELLQKLWEELGNGGSHYRRYSKSLPPLTPRPLTRHDHHAPWMDEHLWNKSGNTKKDLMELMLIQNAQMQQWMMTQTLQRQQAATDSETGTHHHYYDAAGRALPPIRRADAGSQYPQDFFNDKVDGGNNSRDSREGRRQKDSRDGGSPSKDKNRRKKR